MTQSRKLDGVAFYRAVKVGDGYGLVQFGTRNDPKRTLPPVRHEATTQTGLSHVDGAISMAMASPGTAAGDFFVVVGDITSMDAKGGAKQSVEEPPSVSLPYTRDSERLPNRHR